MKIISWNLNGLRAAWNHGLSKFLDTYKADIFAFQETKTNRIFPKIELDGYEAYWSFCSKKGYSGTLCLTKFKPLGVSYSMENPDFDTEGRIITLEFDEFFFINVYVPNSRNSPDRKDYRILWDKYMLEYFSQLFRKKPVIVAGDFNVPISDDDIYAENRWIELNKEGFQSAEREALLSLIENEFVDSYRTKHPYDVGKYTWWSNRHFKRGVNQGWRLDYCLVSKQICDKIRESTMLSDVMGSDHCPITLDIDLDAPKLCEKHITPRKMYSYAELLWLEDLNVPFDSFNKANLSRIWKSINWEMAEEHLSQMQSTLAKIAYSRDLELIDKTQKRITSSLDARLLAVRHVCDNNGGAGIDNIRWTRSHEKMAAALSLSADGYCAMPSKLFLLNSKGKLRYVRVETYYDKAMQCLYSYALAPVAESWADRKSFAFRKGHSAFDVNEYIKRALSGADAPEWIFIGDVRKCYDNISHDWVLKNIPMSKHVLYEFLKAGYILHGELFPSDVGIGLGSSISPIIANMVLDGLQEYVFKRLHGENWDAIDFAEGNMIRYADDVIFTARTRESAMRIKNYVSEFLAERGLELSDKKSKIVSIRHLGFSFMSRTYEKCGTNVIARPSDDALGRFMTVMSETILGFKGSQKTLIEKLNRKIDGWVTYHKVSHAEEAFRKMDVYIQALLLQLCKRKHPNPKWTHERLFQKYWYVDEEGKHRYALPNKKEFNVKFLADTLLVDYSPVRINSNAYIDLEYFEQRSNEKQMLNVTGVYRSIWERQNGRCHHCGKRILCDERKALIETSTSENKFTSRMSYIHERCSYSPFEFVDVDTIPTSLDEILKLLKRLDERKECMGDELSALFEFFRNCRQKSVTLKLCQISKIMGKKLPENAIREEFWTSKGLNDISQCWINNGYEIGALYLEGSRRRVVFRKPFKSVTINIPEVIKLGKIPKKAKYELENYFKYILKKYGL